MLNTQFSLERAFNVLLKSNRKDCCNLCITQADALLFVSTTRFCGIAVKRKPKDSTLYGRLPGSAADSLPHSSQAGQRYETRSPSLSWRVSSQSVCIPEFMFLLTAFFLCFLFLWQLVQPNLNDIMLRGSQAEHVPTRPYRRTRDQRQIWMIKYLSERERRPKSWHKWHFFGSVYSPMRNWEQVNGV